MEKEDDPYDFDQKFEKLDTLEQRKTQQYNSNGNEEDYYTFGSNKEQIINIPDHNPNQQSIYAPDSDNNQTGSLPSKVERESVVTVSSGQDSDIQIKLNPMTKSQILHRVHQGVYQMMS